MRKRLIERIAACCTALALFTALGCVSRPVPVASPQALSAAVASLRQIGPGEHLLVGAGDIAVCGAQNAAARATAAIIEAIPEALVFAAGDNAYSRGSREEYEACYEPAWGGFRGRTRPAPGNHDYRTAGAAGYFEYFASRTGEPGKSYYSFDLGSWHIISLDSNIDLSVSSPQMEWLRSDLRENGRLCVLAFWHHPLFSSGIHGLQKSDPGRQTRPAWEALREAGADVILNGHDHDYERFAPQNAAGQADAGGIREFVVGTGGVRLRRFPRAIRNSEFRDDRSHGVLVLTLRPTSFDWHFVNTAGSITDRSPAAQPCHE